MIRKHLKIPLGIILIMLLSGIVTANDFAFFSSVQKVFKTQGLHVTYDNMKFINTGDKRYFMISLESRRTDIDRSMLVGFYASGVAMQRTKDKVDGVNLMLTISKKDDEKLMVTAGTADIMDLLNKKITANQFVSSRVSFY